MFTGFARNANINSKHEMGEKIWIKLMALGAHLGCHQRADRSFIFRNYQFPVCARCTGIIVSTIIAWITYWKVKLKTPIAVLLIIPMAIDGSVQYFKHIESDNKRRFITGLMGGYGTTTIRLNLYTWVFRYIKSRVIKNS